MAMQGYWLFKMFHLVQSLEILKAKPYPGLFTKDEKQKAPICVLSNSDKAFTRKERLFDDSR
jgi:hypothetical protein